LRVYLPGGNKAEGSEVVTKCDHLKMVAQDGKMRETDVAEDDRARVTGIYDNMVIFKRTIEAVVSFCQQH
jgi:hypothetical protein